MTETPDITQLVNACRQGDASALDQRAPFVYEELKRLARTQMRSESPQPRIFIRTTCQPDS